MKKDDFMSLLKNRKTTESNAVEGGFLLPPTFLQPRRGAWSWFLRLINNKRGWNEVKTIDYLRQVNK